MATAATYLERVRAGVSWFCFQLFLSSRELFLPRVDRIGFGSLSFDISFDRKFFVLTVQSQFGALALQPIS